MCLVSLKKKWGFARKGKNYYGREGLMNCYRFSWLFGFYSDILLVGNCLKRNSGLSEA